MGIGIRDEGLGCRGWGLGFRVYGTYLDNGESKRN